MADCTTNVDDIEDIVNSGIDEPTTRMQRHEVQPSAGRKVRRAAGKAAAASEASETTESLVTDDEGPVGDNIPGIGTIYIKTWGCAHNNSDGEYMAGLLAHYGYTVTEEKDKANLWILNSCTVKNPAQDHFTNTIKEAKSKDKKLVIAGCVPQAAPKLHDVQGISIVGVQQIDRVIEVVEETLKGNKVKLMGQKKEGRKKLGGAPLNLPKIRKNPLVEIIPISTGCLNSCTYCKTKHARGELGSYQIDQIVDRVRQVVTEGVKEIWLTSEDTGAYGRDIETNLPQLLWAILEELPDPVMLRLGMTNPPYIKEHIADMAKIFRHPRIYSYLHIPVQSASDKVLNDMRREYTRADFEYIVDNLREELPDLNIATDLICGFPTEGPEDHAETVDLVHKYKFSVLFVNQFFPRPGTPAANLKRLPTTEAKKRTAEISAWFKAYQPYTNRLGMKYSILVTEKAPDGVHYAGRNKAYEMILVDPNPLFMGQMVDVEITEVGKFYMAARVLPESLAKLPSSPTMPLAFSAASAPSKERARVTIHSVYSDNCDVGVEKSSLRKKKLKADGCEDDDCCGGTCQSDEDGSGSLQDHGHDHHHTHEDDDHGYSSDDEREPDDTPRPPPQFPAIPAPKIKSPLASTPTSSRSYLLLLGLLIALLAVYTALQSPEKEFL